MSMHRMGIRRPRSRSLPVFSLLLLVPLLAAPDAGAVSPDEVGGVRASPRVEKPDGESPPPLDPTVRIAATRVFFSEADMSDTYSGMNGAEAQLSLRIADSAWFYAATGYAEAKGNPFHGTIGFDGYDAVTVRAVPIRMGLRDDMVAHPDFAIWWGLAAEASWIREETPSASVTTTARNVEDGWGRGLWFTFGPEYLWSGGDRGVGIEAAWGGSSGEVAHGTQRHEVNLTGMSIRLYLDWAL